MTNGTWEASGAKGLLCLRRGDFVVRGRDGRGRRGARGPGAGKGFLRQAHLHVAQVFQGRGEGRVRHQRHVQRVASQLKLSARSEEHTSELQSRENLVCRLLLEKKTAN